jgi:protein phosphatase
MKEKVFGQSDVGLVRKKNQDAFGLFSELGLYIIADGMGGRPAGEVASQMTVDLVHQFLSDAKKNHPEQWADQHSASRQHIIRDAILFANKKVFDLSESNPAYHGMGTTVVVLTSIVGNDTRSPTGHNVAGPFAASVGVAARVGLGYVGDSRAYRHRGGKLDQLTQDHSVVNEYIKMGMLTPEGASNHSLKHVLSRGVGVGDTVLPDTLDASVEAGDLFLLCTDGLSNMLDHQEINAILNRTKGNISDAAVALIEGAKEKGGRDNITVVLVSYEADGPGHPEQAANARRGE